VTGLTFDEASHTYRFNGELVPGVTSILQPLSDFSFVDPDVLAAASAFGTAVHRACELDDLGELDEESLDDALVPYLSAWRRFCTDHAAEWTMVEGKVFHPSLRYAGTLDRYGKLQGKPWVVDIKTSTSLMPSVGPQLAAYKNAIPSVPPLTGRMAVQLKADGNYVAKSYTDRSDWPLFCSLLTLRQWCAQHSITPNFKEPCHV
jgi:hypothetical protein